MSNRILTEGLLLFNTKISPHMCQQEKFIDLLICFKCYKMEEHSTRECTSTKTVCSECGEEGHLFRECTNENKKCLNCAQPHRTLAAKCPYRKQKTTAKENELTKKQNKTLNNTYADIAKTAIQETQPKQINITRKTDLKMTALILEAHIAALTGKKKFGEYLSESLRLNFDIDVKFPDRNSQQIFNIYQDRMDNDKTESDITIDDSDTMDTETQPTKRKQKDLTPTEDKSQPKPQRQKTSKRRDSKTSQPTSSQSATPFNSPTKKPPTDSVTETSKKIGFYIYKSADDPYDYKTTLPLGTMCDLLTEGKLKFALPKGYSKQQLYDDLKNGRSDSFAPVGNILTMSPTDFDQFEPIFSVSLKQK